MPRWSRSSRPTQTAHPDIVQMFSIGKSYLGREIWAVKVSDNVATDEPEPEVLFDSLHHAREHLSLEQNLALLRWLTNGYGTDARITQHRRTRARSGSCSRSTPTAREYDLTGDPYREWRKNRQPNAGSTAIGHGPQPQLRLPAGLLRRLVGHRRRRATYRGKAAFSAPETRAMRDFMLSRRIGGVQQIKAAITFHTAGEQILWPYGYTKNDVPSDMTVDDHAALAAMGKKMANLNGYHADAVELACTSPTATRSTGRTARQRIWMYTFELYPSHAQGQRPRPLLPGRRADRAARPTATARRSCTSSSGPAAGTRSSARRRPHCGPLFEDFEIATGWDADPLGTDTATGGAWQRGNPAVDGPPGGTVPSGSRALVTGAAGRFDGVESYDVDGGVDHGPLAG